MFGKQSTETTAKTAVRQRQLNRVSVVFDAYFCNYFPHRQDLNPSNLNATVPF